MRVLWLCNRPLDDRDAGGTGGWLDAMARALAVDPEVELGIIAAAAVPRVTRQDYQRVRQWLVPAAARPERDGLPASAVVAAIAEAAATFGPDLVQIWGTENYWGLLTARRRLPYPALLTMQGIKGAIADVYFGGLAWTEQLRCIGLKELLKRRTLRGDRRDYRRWGVVEQEMIRGHRFIEVQSPWTASQVQAHNPAATLFRAERVLRPVFDKARPWQAPVHPVIFCTAAYPAPFKGMHVAIRALALLRRRVPDVRLRVAGAHQRPSLRLDGYVRWLNGLARTLGVEAAVDWLGPLPAEQIVAELQFAAAAVIPTFIESYGVALLEAMRVGTPTVSAFTGGTSYLGRDEETCLFFPPGDAAMCAYQLERLLTDRPLAARLSERARAVTTTRNDAERQVQRQVDVYRKVCAG